jgi:tetratricopeptide (TPR) repeat protein
MGAVNSFAEGLCRSFAEQGKFNEAIEACSNEIINEPDNASFYNLRGYTYASLQRYEESINDFKKVIQLDPENYYAYATLGNVYLESGQYEDALEVVNKSIMLNKNNYDAYDVRGLVYEKLEKYDDALRDYSKSIEINPKNDFVWNNRGLLHEVLGNFQEALNDHKSNIFHNPDKALPYNGLAWFLATCKDKSFRNGKEAIKNALKAIEIVDDPEYMDTLAAAYIENKEYEKAIETYEKVIQKDKNFIKHYQKGLKEQGFYRGSVDGVYNEETKKAISQCVLSGKYIIIEIEI